MFLTEHAWCVTVLRWPLRPPSSVGRGGGIEFGVDESPLARVSAEDGVAGHTRVRMRWTVWLGRRRCARGPAPPVGAGAAREGRARAGHRWDVWRIRAARSERSKRELVHGPTYRSPGHPGA